MLAGGGHLVLYVLNSLEVKVNVGFLPSLPSLSVSLEVDNKGTL